MIRPIRNPKIIDDDAFANIIKPAYNEITNYLNNEIIYDFFASYYKNNAIWEDHTLELEYKDTLDYLSNVPKYNDLDINKLKKILKEKHSLVLTSANPIGLKEI